jgi:aminoglycoside 6'-N-acetyltransferase I
VIVRRAQAADLDAWSARALCAAIAAWGRDQGCTELASDALEDNVQSHAFHRAIGFEETERVVYFRMLLPRDAGELSRSD